VYAYFRLATVPSEPSQRTSVPSAAVETTWLIPGRSMTHLRVNAQVRTFGQRMPAAWSALNIELRSPLSLETVA
jgi:hypothetical protein